MLNELVLALLMLGLFIQAATNRDWAILRIKEGEGDKSVKTAEGDSDADSDDSAEDTDDSSDDTDTEDTTDESDSDEDDSESIAKAYFTDPSSINPKLRADFKQMQGVFTRKMQEASLSIEKAQAFDTIVQDPAFQEWAETRRNGTIQKTRKQADDTEDDTDDKPLTKSELMGILRQMRAEDTEDTETRKEWDQFQKDTPDWKVYQSEMKVILRKNPKLTYNEAYYLASRSDRDGEQHRETIRSKKGARSLKPGGTGGKEPVKKGKLTWDQAWQLARKQLKLS